jgi:DNA mismatch repair protein MutS2
MTSLENALSKLEFEKVRNRVLRYASSDPGREKLEQLQVMFNVHDIRGELARVSEMKRLLEQEEGCPLEGIQPIRTSTQKAAVEGMVLQPRELWQVLTTLRASRVLRSFAAKHRNEFPLLWELTETLISDKVLEYNIEQAVDETGAVRASASRELLNIRRAIADRYDSLKKRLTGILKEVSELGFSQEEIITTREGRMVIPVKVEHKNRVHGFIHSASASGATVFIEPTETLELNNEITSLQFQEQREIERILRGLTAQVGAQKASLLASLDRLAQVDAIHAKAKYSIEILGIAPVVNAEGPLRFLQARHPLLLAIHGREGTVPLDLELGARYSTLVISGPNAGGKSVAMKALGLLALMAQAGLHIPASDGSVLRVFRKIFVDIGDEQSIESDLSTFSSHLAHLKEIVEQADAESLVLIDEIGSGTDPGEGGAIAASVLEWLTRSGAYTVATTHQGYLKGFAYETPGIENGAMEFDQESLRPTYRFRSGIPGSSYALEMAARLGFSDDIMDRSHELLGKDQHRLERLITDLESSAQRYRKDAEDMTRQKERAETLAREYESKIGALSREIKEMKLRAVEEAQQIVDRANAVIEQSVRQIRESSAEKTVTRSVREEVTRLKQELSDERKTLVPEEHEEAPAIGVGSTVSLKGETEAGDVVSIAPDGKSAVVVFGNMKMRVAVEDLRPARKKHSATRIQTSVVEEKQAHAQRELDLRGMTGDEAIPLVDKFLDDALLAGLHRVDIIHGKGTGALRKKIIDFLATHPRVLSHRLGEWNEGGTGATVVELKDA